MSLVVLEGDGDIVNLRFPRYKDMEFSAIGLCANSVGI